MEPTGTTNSTFKPWAVAIVILTVVALGIYWSLGERPAGSLTVVSWGGSTQEALREHVFDPFETSTGTSIQEATYGGELELVGDMVAEDRVVWDVVHMEDDMMFLAGDRGWLEPVPADLIADESLRGFSRGYGVPIFSWGTVLAWNVDRLNAAGVEPPGSWAALWDEAYPGPIGMRRSPIGTIEIALLGNGYDRDSLYPLTPDKVEEALGYLDQIRDKISWWSGGAEHQQKLVNEYALTAAWSGRVWVMIEQGEAVNMTLTDGLMRYDWWVIPRGSPNVAQALDFLDFSQSIPAQVGFSNATGYGPGNPEARSGLSEDVIEYAPLIGDGGTALALDGRWWSENIGWVEDRWVEWLGQ